MLTRRAILAAVPALAACAAPKCGPTNPPQPFEEWAREAVPAIQEMVAEVLAGFPGRQRGGVIRTTGHHDYGLRECAEGRVYIDHLSIGQDLHGSDPDPIFTTFAARRT